MTYAERIRLSTLEPRWWPEGGDRHGMGISFLCPHCRVTRLAVAFENPLDGGPKSTTATIYWRRAGEDFETITVRPSVDAERIGHWKGFISDGMVHP